jgi:hypothetical protein
VIDIQLFYQDERHSHGMHNEWRWRLQIESGRVPEVVSMNVFRKCEGQANSLFFPMFESVNARRKPVPYMSLVVSFWVGHRKILERG